MQAFRCLYDPLCRHSIITFTICVRDRQTAKSCFEQVVPGDVNCYVVMVCLCCLLHCMPSKFRVQPCISRLPQIWLVTMGWLKKGKEQRFALRQEQSGCFRFHSFPCSFCGLYFSISAAAASFVQDLTTILCIPESSMHVFF